MKTAISELVVEMLKQRQRLLRKSYAAFIVTNAFRTVLDTDDVSEPEVSQTSRRSVHYYI